MSKDHYNTKFGITAKKIIYSTIDVRVGAFGYENECPYNVGRVRCLICVIFGDEDARVDNVSAAKRGVDVGLFVIRTVGEILSSGLNAMPTDPESFSAADIVLLKVGEVFSAAGKVFGKVGEVLRKVGDALRTVGETLCRDVIVDAMGTITDSMLLFALNTDGVSFSFTNEIASKIFPVCFVGNFLTKMSKFGSDFIYLLGLCKLHTTIPNIQFKLLLLTSSQVHNVNKRY